MPSRPRVLALGLTGLAIGTWSTLCGIGGGIFAVPLLHYVYGLELRAAVASSLWLVAASTSAATIAEIVRPDSVLHLRVVMVLVFFSSIGAQAGYRVALWIDARRLKVVFCVVLAAVGAKVLFAATGPPGIDSSGATSATAVLEPTWGEYAVVGAVGLLAGFVAPLLGIGGGLVAVPGLFLGVPAIGYATARACSTAMSVFNSWQSVWLYRRKKLSHAATAAWLSSGALLGGLVGDALIHHGRVVAIAQRLLALTMFLAAARFAWDLRAARERAS